MCVPCKQSSGNLPHTYLGSLMNQLRFTISATQFFFFNDPAPTEIYTLPLHAALPIYQVEWRDPETGYLRRQVFNRPDHPLEIVRVELPARQRVTLPAASYAHIRQAVWMQSGRLVIRSEEHTSELQSLRHLVCRLLLEK